MKTALKRMAMVVLAGLVLALPLVARAEKDDDGDHDKARDLYERGEIKGLSKILMDLQVPDRCRRRPPQDR
mgnify:CR=1 FL=1